MNRFLYEDRRDIWDLLEFLIECKMEKKPAIIIQDGEEYVFGVGPIPPLFDELEQLCGKILLAMGD